MYEGMADLRHGLSGEAGVTKQAKLGWERSALGYGAEDILTVERVRAAFAQAAKDNHPDTGNLGVSYGYTMKELQHARDVLLDELAVINRACKLCSGVGKVRSTMGWRQCGACAGTGERR